MKQPTNQVAGAQSGEQGKLVMISWRYTPDQPLPGARTSAAPASRYQAAAMPSTSGAPATYNLQGQNQVNNLNYAATNPGNTNGSPGATGYSSAAGMASNMAQTGAAMRDSAMNAGNAVTNSFTQTATDATTQLQKSATDKITSLFHRSPKTSANQSQQSGSTPAIAPSHLVAGNKEPVAPVSTSPSAPNLASGPSFAICNAAAGATEYVSEVFPVLEPDMNKLRFAFWQVIGHQHQGGPVAYNTVSCQRAASEEEANALRTTALDTASKRGVPASQVVNTGWSYLGQ